MCYTAPYLETCDCRPPSHSCSQKMPPTLQPLSTVRLIDPQQTNDSWGSLQSVPMCVDRCELETDKASSQSLPAVRVPLPDLLTLFTHSAKAESAYRVRPESHTLNIFLLPIISMTYLFHFALTGSPYLEYPPIPRSYVSSISATILLPV